MVLFPYKSVISDNSVAHCHGDNQVRSTCLYCDLTTYDSLYAFGIITLLDNNKKTNGFIPS